jgi:putative hydroxymethylpyrimidine transport system substrate-binding protein
VANSFPLGFDAVLRILSVIAAAAALATASGCDIDDVQEYRVALALDFQPNAVHAGIYAARDALNDGDLLELDVRVPSSSTDSLKLLESGRADMAVVDIHDLGLARERGADLVGVGAVVQRPLAAVIAQPDVRRPRDLEGRRVGVTGLPSDEALLRAVVEHDGGDFDRVRRVTIGFSAVPSMVAGRVDAVVSFWNAEGVALRERGVPTREFRVDDYGAPRYPELVLVVRRESLRQIGEDLSSVVWAIRDGTRAALSDRATAVENIVEASGADEELTQAQLEAVAPALRPPVKLNRRALRQWAEFDAAFGILERPPSVRETFRVGFLRP